MSDITPRGDNSMKYPSILKKASERLFMKSMIILPFSLIESTATANMTVKRITGSVLPSARALKMLEGTMVLKKPETVVFARAESKTTSFASTMPRPGRRRKTMTSETALLAANIRT